ncbi:16S rRNA (guanine(527)-N(7))-methyltransferase RsmG [Neptunicoccus cionae]|uniref:16S rRNA (guanine(527)-N(7))-methyltransferase RsmG n=1 Tax=Neptunicoccus cionae TaxID=2035344 RepID=UPI000C75CC6C|nr:16S rRNA (guanine(527)-N(7))-methyltransferase RsmG [Amylibacter cionae]PLS22772.1 16S rRNA (guanine(527)-N(7))-methyltransferase RsmG [Amylibacter cionae]
MINQNADLSEVCQHFDVSRETLEKLELYSNALLKWNPTINLVSKSTLDAAAVRHFADSMQLWQYRKEFGTWVDIGSGAGFPGMVLAIIASDQAPESAFHFVESDARKSAFLRNVSRETGVKVKVHTQRIEDFDAVEADIVSARALAPLGDLLSLSKTFLKKDGICLYLKGQNCEHEVGGASRFWTFEAEQFASETDVNGTVLRVRDIERVRT